MKLVLHLLWPRYRSINAAWEAGSRIERAKYLLFAFIGLTFWALIYLLSVTLLHRVAAEELYGDFLLGKLLSFLAMLFFAVLVFSNMVTSLSTFFLAEDLPIHVSAPVPTGVLFVARYVESAVASSWMVLLFAVPILIAYGKVLGSPFLFYPWMIVSLAAFLLLPAALGVVISMVMVKVFPARKMHDILVIVAVLMMVALYLLFRFLRPEQLFNPDLFHGFAEYFATLRTPDSYVAPANWFSLSILSVLRGSWLDGLFYFGLLLSNGLVALLLAQWLAGRIYAEAYSKSQEGRRARLTVGGFFERALERVVGFFGPPTREIVKKDVRSFFRETAQWTQLLLLLGLVVVYLFNFKVLHLERIAGITAYYINLVAFLNIVLAAFLIAAVSVRFVVPLISLEGQAYWVLRAAPLRVSDFVLGKFLLALVPLSVMAEVLIVLSNYFLGASALLFWVSAPTILLLTVGTTAMAIGVGARYPNFREQNVARLSTGASSIIYMILAMLYVVGAVVLLFFPVRRIYTTLAAGIALSTADWLGAAGAAAGLLFGTAAVTVVSLRVAVRSLEDLEW